MIIKTAEILILLFIAIISDIKTCKIQNIVTIPFAIIGFGTNSLLYGVTGIKLSLIGWLIPVAVLFVFYALRMLGAGDIKLYGAIGTIMGCKFALLSIIYSFIFGGFIGIILLTARRNSRERFRYLLTYLKSCLLTFKLLDYSDFEDKGKKDTFRFTFAAVPGTLAELAVVLLNLKGGFG